MRQSRRDEFEEETSDGMKVKECALKILATECLNVMLWFPDASRG